MIKKWKKDEYDSITIYKQDGWRPKIELFGLSSMNKITIYGNRNVYYIIIGKMMQSFFGKRVKTKMRCQYCCKDYVFSNSHLPLGVIKEVGKTHGGRLRVKMSGCFCSPNCYIASHIHYKKVSSFHIDNLKKLLTFVGIGDVEPSSDNLLFEKGKYCMTKLNSEMCKKVDFIILLMRYQAEKV